jgi:enterochelin esterase-like enzyme
MLLLALLAAQAPPPPCAADRVCDVPLALSPIAAARLLGSRPEIWWVNGDVLTVVARRDGEAQLCCAIQRPLHPIGSGLQAASLRVPDIDSAIFDIQIMPGPWAADFPVWRGRSAPPRPATTGARSGLGERHILQSAMLGGARGISVYVPSGIPAGEKVPAIYFADGLSGEFVAVLEAAVRAGRIAPVVIVGIDAAGSTPDPSCAPRCDPRSREYLVDIPNATPEEARFNVHARFVAEEVIPFVESHYPVLATREGRATAGYSSGGSWAVTMAARRPDLFAKAIAMSVGWLPAAETASGLGHTQLFLAAGRLEGDRFIDRTSLAANLARRAGGNVRLVTPNAGHDFNMWEIAFADALGWLFPPAP